MIEVKVTQGCPHCGWDNLAGFGARGEVGGGYWVECPNCYARGPIGETEAEAIAAWNTRQSATTEALAVMERVREVVDVVVAAVDVFLDGGDMAAIEAFEDWHPKARQALAALTEQIERMRGEAQQPSGAMTGE